MTILLTFAFCILFADILGALIFVGPNLPEGYEDERGFHFGSESSASPSLSPAIPEGNPSTLGFAGRSPTNAGPEVGLRLS